MDQKSRQRHEALSRLLVYILGRAPDEFGLVLDPEGWVDLKQLVQALSEEEGWSGMREARIRDLTWALSPCPFEIEEKRIRLNPASGEKVLLPIREETALPNLLYHACRRKPYRVILSEGLAAPPGKEIVLSRTREMALRIGRRRDPKAILVEVHTGLAASHGGRLLSYGDRLFVSEFLPKDSLVGPPPKEEEAVPPTRKKKTPEKETQVAPHPASFHGVPWSPSEDRLLARTPEEEKELLRKQRNKKRVSWKDDNRKAGRKKGGEDEGNDWS